MSRPRGDFAMAYLDGRITVVGGEDLYAGGVRNVEWYSVDEDCWTDSGNLFEIPYERFR
ncbi:unnamed protein product [Phaeothamnion confervicola]